MKASNKKNNSIFVWAAAITVFLVAVVFLLSYSKEPFLEKANLSQKEQKPVLAEQEKELFHYFFRLAYSYYQEKSYNKTLLELEELSAGPLRSWQQYKVYALKAAVLRKIDKPYLAIDSMKMAQLGEETAFSYFFIGSILEDLGKYEASKQAFLQTVKLDKEFRQAYEKLGDVAIKSAKYQEALEYFNLAEKKTISSTAINLKLSLTYLLLGNMPFSKNHLEKLGKVEKNRHLDIYYFLWGFHKWKNQEVEQANEYFSKASEVSPTESKVDYLYYWGMVLSATEQYALAIQVLGETLYFIDENSVDYLASMKLLANMYFLHGEYQQSRVLYEEILSSRRNVTEEEMFSLYYNLSLAYFLEGNLNSSLNMLNTLKKENLSLRPAMQQSLDYFIAKAYKKIGNINKAKNSYEEFIDTWGPLPIAVYELLDLQIFANSQGFLEKYKLYTREGENKNFKLLLAKYFESLGDYHTVISLLKAHISEHGENTSVMKKLADSYVKVEEFDVALYYYDKVIERSQSTRLKSEALNNKAFIYVKKGNAKKSLDFLAYGLEHLERKLPLWYNISLINKYEKDIISYKNHIKKSLIYSETEKDTSLLANMHLHLSLIEFQAYNFKKAKKHLQKAYNFNPQNIRVRNIFLNGFVKELSES